MTEDQPFDFTIDRDFLQEENMSPPQNNLLLDLEITPTPSTSPTPQNSPTDNLPTNPQNFQKEHPTDHTQFKSNPSKSTRNATQLKTPIHHTHQHVLKLNSQSSQNIHQASPNFIIIVPPTQNHDSQISNN